MKLQKKYNILLCILVAIFAGVSSSCDSDIVIENPKPDDKKDPTPTEEPEKRIKSVTETAGYVCTFDQASTEDTIKLLFDNGNTYVCGRENGRITSISFPSGTSTSCSYNEDNMLSNFEHDYGGYKLGSNCSYSNGYINEIEGYISLKQDSNFKDQTNFKCSSIVADEEGIKTCVYEVYVSGSVAQTFDVVVSCSQRDNPLYLSPTHCSLSEFDDYFNDLFYCSPKCIENIEVTDRNTSNSYSVKYNCQWNANSELESIAIDHPAKQLTRTYTFTP